MDVMVDTRSNLLNKEIMSLATEVASGRVHDWQPKPPARKSLLGVQTNKKFIS